MTFYDELKWRGLVYQQTDEKLAEIIANEKPSLYIGFDPTATSLHVGSMLPLTALVRAQRAGLRPIALVGGATGMVGDPSGKSEERKLLDSETLERNLAGLRAQLEKYLDFSGSYAATLVNNYDWFRGLGYLEFLRSVGKLFSVNAMIAKESVRARLEDREQGISYTEFSYMLIQAYDFLWLYENHGCRMQVGGSDQWGNITAGIDLVRRKHGVEVYGITMPLVMNSAGQKFGKSEKGAVWIDPDKTSPYELFQFFMQVDDRDVGKFLRYFTFLDEGTITALDETVARAPEKREAQRVLAREVTAWLHGKDECTKAEQAAAALFGGGDLTALDARTLESLFRDAPTTEIAAGGTFDVALIDALVQAGLVTSKGAARREIEGGGVYVNQKQVTDVARRLGAGDLLAGSCVVLRRGKKTYHLLRVR
jgi:tyrosyl-tRNA synthetase